MAQITNGVVKFSENYMNGDLTIFQKAIDLYNNYTDKDGKKGLSYNHKYSLEDKNKALHKIMMAEIKKLANIPDSSILTPRQCFSNPQVKWATFAIVSALVDPIIPDTIIDSIGMFTNVQTGGYGDSFKYDIESNAGRSTRHSEANKTFRGQKTIIPVEHDVSTFASLYRLLSGQENLAVFAMKCARAMETEIAYDAYNTFDTIMESLPEDSIAGAEDGLKISGVQAQEVIKLINRVGAFNSGNKPIIVGTNAAASQLLPSDPNYRYNLDSDYVKIGYVKEFYGADIIILPQKANWQQPYKTLLNDNVLYVLSPASQKPIQLAIEGETLSIADGVYDSANLTQQITFKKSWGVDAVSNATYGVIELSA
jgi:hypothetical protein